MWLEAWLNACSNLLPWCRFEEGINSLTLDCWWWWISQFVELKSVDQLKCLQTYFFWRAIQSIIFDKLNVLREYAMIKLFILCRIKTHRGVCWLSPSKISQKFLVGCIIDKHCLAILGLGEVGGEDVLNIEWCCCQCHRVCDDFIKKKTKLVYFYINYKYVTCTVGYFTLPLCSFLFFQISVIIGVFLYIIDFGEIKIWCQQTGLK